MKRLTHLVEKFGVCAVVPPTPAARKIGEVPLTLFSERSHRRTLLSYELYCRSDMKQPKARRLIGGSGSPEPNDSSNKK